MIEDRLNSALKEHIDILNLTVRECKSQIGLVIDQFCKCFNKGNKILLCGNGGSAADAQHVAGEFINRFRFNRPSLPAISLSTDTSVLTSIGNDSSFVSIFSRQVEALSKEGDILVGISTSGSSPNVINALEKARTLKIITIGFSGYGGNDKMKDLCDNCIIIPSKDTPRIQECQIFVWHVICEEVEQRLFRKN
jgi:D-sedoheptulose 7-phosphate isomerase